MRRLIWFRDCNPESVTTGASWARRWRTKLPRVIVTLQRVSLGANTNTNTNANTDSDSDTDADSDSDTDTDTDSDTDTNANANSNTDSDADAESIIAGSRSLSRPSVGESGRMGDGFRPKRGRRYSHPHARRWTSKSH